jgi:hypothetical protein
MNDRHMEYEASGYGPPRATLDDDVDSLPNVKTVHLTGRRTGKIRVTASDMYVPAGFKKLVLPERGDDSPPLQPGDLADLQLRLKREMMPLEAFSGPDVVTINGKSMGKEAAFKHLVVEWGLRPAAADAVLEKSAGRRAHFRVKQAAPPFITEEGPTVPAFPGPLVGPDSIMGSNYPTVNTTYTEDRLYTGQNRSPDAQRPTAPPNSPDENLMQAARSAAQSGQKEVFDTAMLGSLLNAVREDSMIDRYLPDLMKGTDRIGRILFQFYWHNDEFADRYGDSDMVELEDGLRNAFEAVGDITLKLKQKGVDSEHSEGVNVDLGPLANQ